MPDLRSHAGHVQSLLRLTSAGYSAAGEEAHVFEAFKPRATGAGDLSSLGLGLALVRRIAEAHGGRAYARNVEGGGALVGFEVARG